MKLIDRGGYFVAENAVILGDVTLGEAANVWYSAVIRGDMGAIRIGKFTNIQDGCVLHTDLGQDLDIGDYVTVGHQALIHCRKIGDRCLIGMQSALLAGAEIGTGCVIGAGAVVREGQKIPDYAIAVGVPAKIIGQTGKGKLPEFEVRATHYHQTALRHVEGFKAPWA